MGYKLTAHEEIRNLTDLTSISNSEEWVNIVGTERHTQIPPWKLQAYKP